MGSERLSLGKLAKRGALKFGDGYRTKSTELGKTGFPILRVGSVGDGRVEASGSHDLIRPEYSASIGQKFSELGDIVLTTKGTVGRTARIDSDTVGWVYSPQVCYFRVIDETVVHPGYLYAYMKSPSFKRQAAVFASQTDMAPYLSLKDLADMEIELPPFPEQRRIAKILGDLDDKIELNRKMNETLEAMARALFKSWFVDFDPVRAKMEGRQPEGMDAETAALFPDKLVESELGLIPEGWEVKTIESLCDVITSGGTPARMHKAYWEPATVPWFKTGELLDGPLIDAEEKISEEGLASSSCKLWPAGTILFALYASPTVGRFGVLTKPGTANQAAAALIAKPTYGVPFLVGILYEAREELQRVAIGAAQQNINQGVLKNHVVVAPPPALAKGYSDKVAPLFEQQIKLAEQSRTLAAMRDTLLPNLISGEREATGISVDSISAESISRKVEV